MASRKRTWVALAVLFVLAAVGLVWMRRPPAPGTDPAATGAATGAGSGAAAGSSTGASGAPGARPAGAGASGAPDEQRPAPPWFGEKGLPARQVAGRVTFNGQPLAGAEVRLTHALTQNGYWPAPVA